MTRTVLQTAVSAAAAFALAICFSGPGFAADGDNSGKQIKRFEFVAPKAPVAQFVPPKSGRTGSGLGSGGSPTTVFRLTPKAPVAGSSSGSGTTTAQFVAPKAKKTGSGGSTTAQFVAPKSKKVETQTAKIDTPAKPLLLAPATASTTVAVDQGAPAPEPVAKTIPVETTTPDAGQIESSPREVALAYLRASERYGYGAYAASYSDSEDYGSYEQSAYDESGYADDAYGEEGCW
jgi:hypothetical protein